MDNWWIDPIQGKNNIKYLITAFLKDDDKEDMEILNSLMNKQVEMEILLEEKFDDLKEKLNEIINKK